MLIKYLLIILWSIVFISVLEIGMGLRWRVLKNAAEDQKTKFIREQKKFYYKKWGDYIMGIDSLLRILQIA